MNDEDAEDFADVFDNGESSIDISISEKNQG